MAASPPSPLPHRCAHGHGATQPQAGVGKHLPAVAHELMQPTVPHIAGGPGAMCGSAMELICGWGARAGVGQGGRATSVGGAKPNNQC